MNQNCSSQSQWQAAKTAEKTDKLSLISEWVAPIVVWVVVIALSLAVAGFLLGER